MGGAGRGRRAPGARLHRGLILALLAGCAPARVRYGAVAELPLVHVSTDATRWYTPVETPTGPQVWFVDTGYARTTCDDALARDLGLELRGRTRIRGEAGVTFARRARLPALTLGDHALADVPCQVRDLGSTSSIRDPDEVPVGGVLGIDVLGRFLMEIDPDDGVIRLFEPADLPGGERVRLRLEAGMGPRLEVPVEVDGERVWMLLDTGADRTYVKGKKADLTPYTVRKGARVQGTGTGGETRRDLPYYRVESVDVGDSSLRDMTLVGRARPWWSDGLLGLDVLARLHGWYDLDGREAVVERVREPELPDWEDWEGEPAVTVGPPERR